MALTRAAARTLCASNAQSGLVVGDARLDDQINQALARLIRHRNTFTRSEEYFATPIVFAAATDPLQLDAPDSLKLMVLALWREENGKLDEAAALETRAYGLLDQDIVQAWEQVNRDAYLTAVATTAYTRNWYSARLGLDTAGGLSTSQVKLKRLVSRAADWIYQKQYEYQLIERNRVRTAPVLSTQPSLDTTVFSPTIDYEVIRLVTGAMALQGFSPQDPAQQQNAATMLTQAAGLITRRMDAELEALRHGTYQTALAALTSDTFGYTVARLGLEMPVGLKLSTVEMKRLVNSAEERLVSSGKWKNSIADFEVVISVDGNTDMPPEVETVLGATICCAPTIIMGRYYQVHENGPGRVSEDRKGVAGIMVDRGEVMVSGSPRRRYFIPSCQETDELGAWQAVMISCASSNGIAIASIAFDAVPPIEDTTIYGSFKREDDFVELELWPSPTAQGRDNGQAFAFQPNTTGTVTTSAITMNGAEFTPTFQIDEFARGEFAFAISRRASPKTVMVCAKRRFATKTADATLMQIPQFSAIKSAAQCLLHEGWAGQSVGGMDVRDAGLAAFYWKNALGILSDQRAEHAGDSAQMAVSVQGVGFAASDIPNLL